VQVSDPIKLSIVDGLNVRDTRLSNYPEDGTVRKRLAAVDRCGVDARLDVRGVIFLDHLDAGAAVFGDLVDVRAFHEAQADIGVRQAVRSAPVPIAVKFEILLIENPVELLLL